MIALSSSTRRPASLIAAVLMVCALAPFWPAALDARPADELIVPPAPRPAVRPPKPSTPPPAERAPAARPTKTAPVAANPAHQAQRLARINAARSWGYQLNGLKVEEAAASPYDLLVVDATTGLASGRPFLPEEVQRLKRKADGAPRLVVSYLSIGEAEDYRPDYFTAEYLTEDAPDWLMKENPQWKGNRIIRFCKEGWQRTILGDEDGRSVYNSIEASPLYRLVEAGFDGVYLDRVDVYSEVTGECPDAQRKMIEFVARLAAHARKRNPNFIVILQNAEELLQSKAMIDAIDAIAKEDLFYGADHTESANSASAVRESVGNLRLAKAAGRPVFVVDYLRDKSKIADTKRRIEAEGFVPYIAPRDLGALWLPGRNF